MAEKDQKGVIILTYIDKGDPVQLLGDDFYKREKTSIELFSIEENKVIYENIYKFKKEGENKVKLKLKGNIYNF